MHKIDEINIGTVPLLSPPLAFMCIFSSPKATLPKATLGFMPVKLSRVRRHGKGRPIEPVSKKSSGVLQEAWCTALLDARSWCSGVHNHIVQGNVSQTLQGIGRDCCGGRCDKKLCGNTRWKRHKNRICTRWNCEGSGSTSRYRCSPCICCARHCGNDICPVKLIAS